MAYGKRKLDILGFASDFMGNWSLFQFRNRNLISKMIVTKNISNIKMFIILFLKRCKIVYTNIMMMIFTVGGKMTNREYMEILIVIDNGLLTFPSFSYTFTSFPPFNKLFKISTFNFIIWKKIFLKIGKGTHNMWMEYGFEQW